MAKHQRQDIVRPLTSNAARIVFSVVCFVTGNIGYHKTATQSGTRKSWSADRALDGYGYGAGASGLDWCTHTDPSTVAPEDTAAYWRVDLGKRHRILNVTIYNRRK